MSKRGMYIVSQKTAQKSVFLLQHSKEPTKPTKGVEKSYALGIKSMQSLQTTLPYTQKAEVDA